MTSGRGRRAWIGLGANIGAPLDQIRAALAGLEATEETSLEAVSSCYRSTPVGNPDQPDYLNGVARICTSISPLALLSLLQDLEKKGGRQRPAQRDAPRKIDLDLLLLEGCRYRTAQLIVPHPRLHKRRFVLEPLLELEGDIELPGLGRASTWLKRRREQSVERLIGVLLTAQGES